MEFDIERGTEEVRCARVYSSEIIREFNTLACCHNSHTFRGSCLMACVVTSSYIAIVGLYLANF